MSDGPKIEQFPGAKLSPEVLLHKMLEQADQIEAIAMVVHWRNDTVTTGCSNMNLGKLIMSALLLHDDALAALKENS